MSLPQRALRVSGGLALVSLATALYATGGLDGAIAAGAKPVSQTIFDANFDSSTSKLTPSVGSIYVFVADQNAVKIKSDGTKGNKLVIDDSFNAGGSPTAVACQFKSDSLITTGIVTAGTDFTLGASNLPFEIGIVIDLPQSDMVPATGPDDGGILWVGGTDTGQVVPQNVDLRFTATYSRADSSADWQYVVDVIEREAIDPLDAFHVHIVGTIANSANKPIVGFALQKNAGTPGEIGLDNIHADYAPSTYMPPKKR